MAETSYLWDNPGTGDSPGAGYGNALLNQIIFRMLYNGTGDQGVILGWLNDLEVTDGGVDTATVDTGAAFLYGVWYETDAAVNVNINAYRGGNCLIVVRASWAAQTARIVARAVGALTQNPGVTYEIPLANVAINGAGAITLVTDTRDYCIPSTSLRDFGVKEDMIATDAATIAKMADQTRTFLRGAGAFAPDGTNPATWTNYATGGFGYYTRDEWTFTDAVADAIWCTIRVPPDISGANLTIYLWHTGINGGVSGDTRWTYSIWQAAADGVAANSTGAVAVTADQLSQAGGYYCYLRQDTLVAQAVTAGDLLHIQVARDGGHAADTYAGDAILAGLYFSYTADS